MSDALARLSAACAKLPHATRPMFGGHAFLTPEAKVSAAVMPVIS